jgi:hypothetical protein
MPQKSSQKARTWGTRFDPLPSSPPASPLPDESVVGDKFVAATVADNSPEMPYRRREDKIPHDASVFVGR